MHGTTDTTVWQGSLIWVLMCFQAWLSLTTFECWGKVWFGHSLHFYAGLFVLSPGRQATSPGPSSENQGFEINGFCGSRDKRSSLWWSGFHPSCVPPPQFHALDVGQSLGTCPVWKWWTCLILAHSSPNPHGLSSICLQTDFGVYVYPVL